MVRATWDQARGLAALGVEVTVLTTNANIDGIVNVPEERIEAGVRILTSPIVKFSRTVRKTGTTFSPGLISNIVRNVGRCDLIHVAGVWGYCEILAAAAARTRHKPLVISTHGMLGKVPLAHKRAKKMVFIQTFGRIIFRQADGVHFTAEAEKKQAPSWLIGDKGFVVPNAVEIVEKGDPKVFREKLGLERGAFVIGIFGRVHMIKGFDLIVPALGRCKRKDLVLVVAGPDEGGYRVEVEKMICEAGLGDRVIFTGMLLGRDLADAYAGIDVLVLPSHHENFGNVVVEAMAQGTPVMVSDQVGLKDWVVKNDAGIVLPLDVDAWVAALDGLKREEIPNRWEPVRMVEAARSSFSIDAVARMMLVEYEKIFSSRRSG